MSSFSLAEDGFQIVRSVLTDPEIIVLRAALDSLKVAPGFRSLAQRAPVVAALSASTEITALLRNVLGMEPFLVRSIFFDKTAETNWLVPWHQDLTIAVKNRVDIAGYGPWSVKNGVPHVQPPREMLESIITLRLHLDDCDVSNGALRVIPGSHRSGRLNADAIAEARIGQQEVICNLCAGDGLLLRPLLLHASSQATKPRRRRVIHLEYSTRRLPDLLKWAERVDAA